MDYKSVYLLLKDDLKRIERELENALYANSPLLKETSLHYLHAGGKRIRPVFVLLSSKFGEEDNSLIRDVAVSLELIHMASLIHDDVVDNADIRRGRPTVKAKWDNRIAMYTGDYILAKSLELISKLDSDEAHQVLSKTMVELSIGEIEQIRDKFNFDQPLTNYFRRIKRKTALLIASCCQLGAIAAGASESVHRKLFQFGYYVGMAFQIKDDLLDLTSDEEKLGKPAGSDLLQGNITLPVLLALRDPKVKKEIVKVQEITDQNFMEKIISLIKETDALEKTIEISKKYVDKALQILEELPENETKTLLKSMIYYVVQRQY